MSIHIASIAHLLPPADEVMQAPGESRAMASRRSEAVAQGASATERVVLWDAEEQVADDDEPEIDQRGAVGRVGASAKQHVQDDVRMRNERVGLLRTDRSMPVGLKMANGGIGPVPPSAVEEAMRRASARAMGDSEGAGDDIGDVSCIAAAVDATF